MSAKRLRTELAGKTVLVVMRTHERRFQFFTATTHCRECRAECSIAPASIERLRAQPEIVVLCSECAMVAHESEPFDSVSLVSPEELRDALERQARTRGKK